MILFFFGEGDKGRISPPAPFPLASLTVRVEISIESENADGRRLRFSVTSHLIFVKFNDMAMTTMPRILNIFSLSFSSYLLCTSTELSSLVIHSVQQDAD